MRKNRAFNAALTLALATLGAYPFRPAMAQSKKIPVSLSASVGEDDPVGRQLAFELKEALLGSNSFRLEDGKTFPFLRLTIVTVKTGEITTANSLTFSYDNVGFPMLGIYITSSVQACGRNAVRDCARSILSSLDQAAEYLKKEQADLYLTLQNKK